MQMRPSSSIFLAAIASFIVCLCCYTFIQQSDLSDHHLFNRILPQILPNSLPTIFVITRTSRNRLEQKTDLTRLSQTLQLVEKIHWIVIEDSEEKTDRVIDVLNVSGLSYTHFSVRGNSRFNSEEDLLNETQVVIPPSKYGNGSNVCGVVYFADDDNSYDVRLFNNYIRHAKGVGVWAVGFAGGQKVLSPFEVHGLNSSSPVDRNFSADMAEFAVNLHLILSTEASFVKDCPIGRGETCFLEQLNVSWDQLEPFGFDTET